MRLHICRERVPRKTKVAAFSVGGLCAFIKPIAHEWSQPLGAERTEITRHSISIEGLVWRTVALGLGLPKRRVEYPVFKSEPACLGRDHVDQTILAQIAEYLAALAGDLGGAHTIELRALIRLPPTRL